MVQKEQAGPAIGMEQLYEEYRAYAFSIAYRMLGTVSDAEDAVQEMFAELSGREWPEVRHWKGYLAKWMTNRCLNVLRSARRQREIYVGEWLPEPWLSAGPDPGEELERKDTLAYAYLVLLELLTPAERAVFVLREAFDYDYEAIAGMLEKTEVNCRKIYSRAKSRLLEAEGAQRAEAREVAARSGETRDAAAGRGAGADAGGNAGRARVVAGMSVGACAGADAGAGASVGTGGGADAGAVASVGAGGGADAAAVGSMGAGGEADARAVASVGAGGRAGAGASVGAGGRADAGAVASMGAGGEADAGVGASVGSCAGADAGAGMSVGAGGRADAGAVASVGAGGRARAGAGGLEALPKLAASALTAGREAAIGRFVAAFRSCDVGAMLAVLSDDARLVTDGGSRVRSAIRPIISGGRVAALLASPRAFVNPRKWDISPVTFNGGMGLVFTMQGEVRAALICSFAEGKDTLERLYIVLNPDKLIHLQAAAGLELPRE